jgi:predicted transposase YbfD/YdcC
VDEKSNEIPAVKPLLAELPIQGMVVTADAMHTQQKTAKFIVEEKKADYLLTVKDNQPTLRDDIAALNLAAFPPSARNGR